jgi:hypothetical protein
MFGWVGLNGGLVCCCTVELVGETTSRFGGNEIKDASDDLARGGDGGA